MRRDGKAGVGEEEGTELGFDKIEQVMRERVRATREAVVEVEIAQRGNATYDSEDVSATDTDRTCTNWVREWQWRVKLRAPEQRMGRKRWGLARSNVQVLCDDSARANLRRHVQRGAILEGFNAAGRVDGY